jgi:hypothetical protein
MRALRGDEAIPHISREERRPVETEVFFDALKACEEGIGVLRLVLFSPRKCSAVS